MNARTTTLRTAAGAAALALLLGACSTDEGTGGSASSSAQAPTTDDAAGTSSATTDDAAGTTGATTDDVAGTSSPVTDDAAGTTGAAAAVDPATLSDDPACQEFYGGTVPLAGRAEETRAALEAGEVKDNVSWGFMDLLQDRIGEVAGEAEGEQAALLERINAPFVEGSKAVWESEEMTPSDPEITLPEIDVTDSAAAQEEFLAACQG